MSADTPAVPAPDVPATPAAPASNEPAWLRWIGIAVFAAAIVVGAWLRFRDLDLKPLHSDEGVNGWFLMRLFNGLRDFGNWNVNYRYDPTNYHGPFLYFLGLIPFFLFGPSNGTLRVFMAIAGTGCIAVLWPLRRHLGWSGLAMAAWLVAISPPLVYFSRTAIHEIYVAFFSISTVVCLAKCYEGSWRPGAPAFRPNWLLFACVSAGLLFTNKETAVITFASFVGAGAIAWFCSRTHVEEIPAVTRAEKKRKKDKDDDGATAAAPGVGGMASLVRWAGAIVIALGPFAILWKFVKGSRTWQFMGAQQQTWIQAGAAFGVICAICWIAGTRGETFALGARFKRLSGIGRYAVGGVLFLLAGPVFLAKWVADRVPFLESQRPSLERLSRSVQAKLPGEFDDLSDYALAYAWAIALVVILFTSFFNNPRGAIDMFGTYFTWVGRGHEGAGHEKPFGYWIELLWDFDAPILLMGMLGTAVALYRRDRLGLFVASWAWSQWLVYSVISYKTPWLNLNFTLPLAVTGGIALREVAAAVATVARSIAKTPAAAYAGSALVTVSVPAVVVTWPVPAGPVLAPKDPSANVSWWAFNWDVNFKNYDDDRYGIIYVQTVREFEELIEQVETLLRKHGDGLGVWVTSGDYWPMPYYLRDWDKIVGYYQGRIPTGDVPSVVITSSTQEAEMREKLAGYRRLQFMLRPGVALAMFVEPGVYDPVFGPPPGESPPAPAPDPELRAPGLVAEYRSGIGCMGDVLAQRVDPFPKYGGRDREFRAPLCVVWKGYIDVQTEGEWAFGSASDDGSRIFVDGKLVVDNWGTHGVVEREGMLRVLSPGPHSIEVRYFDAGGGASLEVWMRKREEKRAGFDAAGPLFHDVRTAEQPVQKAEIPAP